MENITTGILVLIVIALWTLPWKAVALWKAARSGSKAWFVVLLIINTLAILEILYIFVFSKRKGATEQISNDDSHVRHS